MASQIAIAQAAEDERTLVEQLERYSLLTLPRTFEELEPSPAKWGSSDAEKQVIFVPDAADDLVASVREVEGTPNRYQIHRSAMRGLFLEWNRTTWPRAQEAEPGRFYYDRVSAPSDARIAKTDTAFRAIQRWIKASSPLRSERRHPTYVGARLAEMIRQGEVRLTYPNGTEVSLIENA